MTALLAVLLCVSAAGWLWVVARVCRPLADDLARMHHERAIELDRWPTAERFVTWFGDPQPSHATTPET